jgi:hypothetical protein
LDISAVNSDLGAKIGKVSSFSDINYISAANFEKLQIEVSAKRSWRGIF